MKQLILPVLLITFLGNMPVSAQTKPSANKKPPVKKTIASKPAAAAKAISTKDIEDGKILLGKSDCLACHKTDTKLVGPAYADVAKKYAYTDANLEMLSSKIINGGSGNWGAVPMAAHPSLQGPDVKKMVTYILSLKAR